jgi:hypothetical protein
MTEKEPPPGEKDAETMGADDPYDLKGLLKRLGGSQSDHWNKVLIDQTVHTLGLNRCDGEARERRAALAGLIGIGPQDGPRPQAPWGYQGNRGVPPGGEGRGQHR